MATRPIRYYHHQHQQQQQQQIVAENEKDLSRYCATCNRTFSRRTDLNRHLISTRPHVNSDTTTNAGFPCRVCAKIFPRADSQRKHEGNRSCMKRFSQLLHDARALTHSPLCKTTTMADIGSTTAEIDDYYNSDISSITTDTM